MNNDFDRVFRVLESAWPCVYANGWFAYSKTYGHIDDQTPRYPGIVLLRHDLFGQAGNREAAIGTVKNLDFLLKTAQGEIDLIEPSIPASIEIRRPTGNPLGSAIFHSGSAYALAGLPEVPSYLLLAITLWQGGVISEGQYNSLTDFNSRAWLHLSTAIASAQLSDMNYVTLKSNLEMYCKLAAMRLQKMV